jgi:hypothetical protein
MNAAFKISPWRDASILKKIKNAIGNTPFDFMIEEPDIYQEYVRGSMSTIVRQISIDGSKEKTLPKDWYNRFIRGAGKGKGGFEWSLFFDELYHVAESGSYVYCFKVHIDKENKDMFSLLLTNIDVEKYQDVMMEYIQETRFKEVGYRQSMAFDHGGSIQVEEHRQLNLNLFKG